jgi:hypothetical protein
MRLACLSLPAAFVALPLSAQGVCTPGTDSNEAKMLAFYAAPMVFSPAGTAGLKAGEIRLALDVTYIPAPSDEIISPEECYRTDKTENTELSPVLPRPRLAIGLGRGFTIEGMYLPPVTVLDATPNLLSLALGYTRQLGAGGMGVGIRAHTTLGEVSGAITCAKDVLQTTRPTGSCFATKPSDDTYKPNMVGVEGLLSFGAQSRFRSYLGAGYSALAPRFKVGYVDALNNVDNTEIEVDLNRFAAFAGAAWHLSSRFALTGELYSVPQDLTTIRLGGSFALRPGR